MLDVVGILQALLWLIGLIPQQGNAPKNQPTAQTSDVIIVYLAFGRAEM